MSRLSSSTKLLSVALLIGLTGCPGTPKTGDSTSESSNTSTTTTDDKEVTYELGSSLEQYACDLKGQEDLLLKAETTEEVVNMQALAMLVKWDYSEPAATSRSDMMETACKAVLTDLEAPAFPPAGDCSGLTAKYVEIRPIPITNTINGAQQLVIAGNAAYPDGVWCQITLKDTTKPENLIWAMMFAFNHFHTPALVNWEQRPTLIRAARIRVPSVAVPSFQQIMAGTSTTNLALNYPGVSASILQLDYSMGSTFGTLVDPSGVALTNAAVRDLFGIPTATAIIDPLDQAGMDAMDAFIDEVGSEFTAEECVNDPNLTPVDAYQEGDNAYTAAKPGCR